MDNRKLGVIHANITIKQKPEIDPPAPPDEKKYIGWRVKGNHEGGYDSNPLNMPMVIPPLNAVGITMRDDIQVMSYDLMCYFNSAITRQRWTAVHDHDRAFTNGQGFGKAGDPRRNYILGTDLNAEFPKYDKAQRLSLNMFVRGIVNPAGDKIVCIPGVHGIDSNMTMPSIKEILEKNWYLFAITYYNSYTFFGHFPQGAGGPVAIPFIFDRPIEFPLSYFSRWESDYLPEPLKVY